MAGASAGFAEPLFGWSVVLAPPRVPDPERWPAKIIWTDEIGTYSVARPTEAADWDYLILVEGILDATVDVGRRLVTLHPVAGNPEETLRHVWLDQILPGLLDHDGWLSLHAGAVNLGGAGVLLIGRSGTGKSTLTTSLATPGTPALSDDGIYLLPEGEGFRVAPIYPGLRLLPDSLARLVSPRVETSLVSHYATKRRIHLPDGISADPVPLAAMFFLGPPSGRPEVDLRLMPPARACMGLVEQSFGLDPVDPRRAGARLRQAAEVAGRVPAFALDYPRNYDRLPDVHAALRGALQALADTSPRSSGQRSSIP